MATSPKKVGWKLLGRITDALLPQFWRCQQENSGCFGRQSADPETEVLFTVPIVLRKSRETDLRLPKWNVPVGTRSKPRPFDKPD